MSGEIAVLQRTQYIIVDPVTQSASVINGGPVGPSLAGPQGDSVDFMGNWNSAGIGYLVNDMVFYNGSLYIAKVAHTSSAGNGPVTNTTNWGLSARGFNYRGLWTASTAYKQYDVVVQGGSTFLCIVDHTSVALNDPNVATANWQMLSQGYSNRGTWGTGVAYRVYDIVTYNGSAWLCIGNHTSAPGAPPPSLLSNWSLFARGWNWMGAWVSGTTYRTADIVSYNGASYRANADITTAPGTTTAPDVNASWDVVAAKGSAGAAGAAGLNPILAYNEYRPGTNTTFPPSGYAANTWYDSGVQCTFTTGATTTKVKVTLSVYANANAASSTTSTVLWGLRTTSNVLVTNSDHRALGAASATAAYAGKVTSVFVMDVTANTTYTWKWSVQVNTVATWNHTAGVQFPATMTVEALN